MEDAIQRHVEVILLLYLGINLTLNIQGLGARSSHWHHNFWQKRAKYDSLSNSIKRCFLKAKRIREAFQNIRRGHDGLQFVGHEIAIISVSGRQISKALELDNVMASMEWLTILNLAGNGLQQVHFGLSFLVDTN